MKIALDIRSLETGNRYRGIGYYICNLILNITEVDKANQYLLFAYTHANPLYQELKDHPNIKFCFFPKINVPPRIFWWFDQIGLIWLLIKHRPDLFHSLDYNPPWIRPCPVVVTVHDMIPYVFREQYQKPFDKKWELKIKHYLTRKSDLIITDSRCSKNDIEKILKYPKDKIFPIYLAVDQPKPITQSEKEKIKERYAHGSEYIIYIGEMYGNDFRKKVDWLVESFAKITEEKKDLELKLVLVGKMGGVNNDYDRLHKLVEKFNLKNQVIFTDYLEYEEMIKVLQAAKLFVYPSVYEGFGLPPLQAMACGAPVVSFDNSSIAEVAGEAALLTEASVAGLASGIKKALLDENQRSDMIKKGSQLVQRFDWGKTARATVAVYNYLNERSK